MGESNMKSNIIGIDLAKSVFHICVMNSEGRVLVRHRVSRKKLVGKVLGYKGVVAMEACGGSHYWSRTFKSLGYETRIIAAQFIKPFRKSNKNDAVDAEAICEAASRPQMRFVATRTEEQQDIQNLHRTRERLVKNRTALCNAIRGLLHEYGIVIRQGISNVRKELVALLEEHRAGKSELWLETFAKLYEELCDLDERIEHYDQRIKEVAHSKPVCKNLLALTGIGALIATAAYAAVGDASSFKNGRELSAWLGLTPRQHSTGGKPKLGSISKRGNKYLRTLLVLGARSYAIAAERRRNHKDPHKRILNSTDKWLFDVASRRGSNKAIVALANKMARQVWVVLAGKEFKQPEELLKLAA